MTKKEDIDNRLGELFSFSHSELGPFSRKIISVIEKLTGRDYLKELAVKYLMKPRTPERVWADCLEELNIKLNIEGEGKDAVPSKGKLLVIANHPFGVIDGVALCTLLTKYRSDYKIIIHRVLHEVSWVKPTSLPIDFNETKDALQTNLFTRKETKRQLDEDKSVIIFPAGAISLAKYFFGKAEDEQWKKFVIRLANNPDLTILPCYIHGKNSLLYQIVRKYSYTLGYALTYKELLRHIGSEVTITVNKPFNSKDLEGMSQDQKLKFLRESVYKNS